MAWNKETKARSIDSSSLLLLSIKLQSSSTAQARFHENEIFYRTHIVWSAFWMFTIICSNWWCHERWKYFRYAAGNYLHCYYDIASLYMLAIIYENKQCRDVEILMEFSMMYLQMGTALAIVVGKVLKLLMEMQNSKALEWKLLSEVTQKKWKIFTA